MLFSFICSFSSLSSSSLLFSFPLLFSSSPLPLLLSSSSPPLLLSSSPLQMDVDQCDYSDDPWVITAEQLDYYTHQFLSLQRDLSGLVLGERERRAKSFHLLDPIIPTVPIILFTIYILNPCYDGSGVNSC